MKKQYFINMILGVGLILSGCGTADEEPKANDEPENGQEAVPENESGWETIELVSNRSIIAKLKQTTNDAAKRDKIIEDIKKQKEFKEGLYGEPTEDLAEELSVQQIEGSIVIPILEETYGGYSELDKAGVVFFENKTQGAEQSGIWIGIKKADERLKTFIDTLQEKVDAGEIQAQYIFIYYSPHTQAENNQLTDEVNAAGRVYARQHATPDRLSMAVSVDTITGAINIGHNFLTEEQQQELREKFPEREMIITQEGRLVPLEGEPDITYPSEVYTDKYTKEGSYVMALSDNGMLVVSATAQDFSQTGGVEEFYDAISFEYPAASTKLKIGQRVVVEASGPIMESYPGRGTALYVEVLPEYKPDGADLSETEVVQQAIKEIEGAFVSAIKDLTYQHDQNHWIVSFYQEDEIFEIKVVDKLEN